MPIDLLVEYRWNSRKFYVPLRMMSFEKENPYPAIKERYFLIAWAYPTRTQHIQNQNREIKHYHRPE
jgi:hypothetical protein